MVPPNHTTGHTVEDLLAVFGDLLHYVREDAEVHLVIEHDDEDELCPTKLYDRAQAVADDAQLSRLVRAAPALLAHLQSIVVAARSISTNWETGDLAAAVSSLERIATAAEVAIADPGGTAACEICGKDTSTPESGVYCLNCGTWVCRDCERTMIGDESPAFCSSCA